MPHRISIISAREYLRTDVLGKLDLDTSMKILREIAVAHSKTPNDDILLDVRGANGAEMTGLDIYELVVFLRDLGLGREHKLAVLYQPKDSFDRTRLFEMLAQDRGLRVAAYQDFEEAYNWLLGSADA